MNELINYIVEASVFAGISYLLYLWIKKSISFSFQRFWLLGALILSLFVPFVNWQIAPDSALYAMQLPVLDMYAGQESNAQNAMNWSYWDTIKIIYFTGFLFMSIRFLSGLIPIMRLMIEGKEMECNELTYIYHLDISMPFSFGPYLFWNPRWNFSEYEEEMIRKHETVHIQQMHTIDILLIQFLKIIAWFHPLAYLYEKEIKNIHEYQADQQTLVSYKERDYINLLLQHLLSTKMIVGHSIFQTPIQKRIKMMKESQERKMNYTSMGIATVLLCTAFFYIGCHKGIVDENSKTDQTHEKTEIQAPDEALNDEKVYQVVDQMPRFPGCEEVMNVEEQEKCAQKEMLNWVHQRIDYPAEAKKQKLEGIVLVSFIVNKSGAVMDPEIKRDIGGGAGAEVISTINEMKESGIRWIPGSKQGKLVNVQFYLPVQFALDE